MKFSPGHHVSLRDPAPALTGGDFFAVKRKGPVSFGEATGMKMKKRIYLIFFERPHRKGDV